MHPPPAPPVRWPGPHPDERRVPFRITAWYALVGLAWVWLSDAAILLVGQQTRAGFLMSGSKGTLFFAVTAPLLYWLVRSQLRALSSGYALLRAVTDGTTDAMFVKDRDGTYLLFNEAAARFVGKPVAEVLGRDDSELFDAEGACAVMARDRRVMASGVTETEEEALTAGGTSRTYLATKLPYWDENGNVVGVIGIWRDITERKRVEAEAHQAREMLRLVLDTVPQGVFWKDLRSRHIGCNAVVARALGFDSPEQVVGRSDAELPSVSPEQAATFMRDDQEVIRSGVPRLHLSEQVTWADGSTVYLETNKYPLRDTDGQVVGVIGTWEDVTERRLAERALRESEERFRALVELAPDSIILLLNGRVAFANAAAARMVSAPAPEAMTGLSLTDHIHPNDRANSLARQAAVLERNEVFPAHDVRIRRLDGEYVDVETCAGPCVVGGERGIQVVARDVTERRREARFLAQQYAILERIAAGDRLPLVLEEIVRLIEAQDPGTLGSILLLDREGRLRLGSAPSLPPEYNAAIDGVRIGPSVGSCGTAAYTRVPVFVDDIATDRRWSDFADLALGHGLRACWSVPIFAASRGDDPPAVLGTFAVYSRTPRAPARRLVEVLGRAGHLASIAIENRRVADELRESEAKFRALVEQAADGIFLHDEYGVLIDANAWACRSLGYTRDELIGKTPADFDTTATPERSRQMAAVLGRGEPVAFEGIHRRKDGSTFPVEVRARQFAFEGRRQGMSIARDISDRKRADEASARLAAIVESSIDVIVSKTLDGVIQTWNPGAERLFGYTAAEVVGKPITLLIPPERRAEEDMILARIHAGERVDHLDTVRVAKDGRRIDVSLAVSPVRDAVGRVVGASKIARDITARVRARQRLTVQHAVVSILAEADGLAAAVPSILRVVCEITGWDAGGVWVTDEAAHVLTPVDVWAVPGDGRERFCEVTRGMRFGRGDGLPGRVWQSGEPLWVTDVTTDPAFPRRVAAAVAGLRGGFGFPVRCGGRFLGVVEFFSTNSHPPHEELLEGFRGLGDQIGQFVERKRLEAAERASQRRWRELAESMPQLVWTCGPDGRCDYLSRQWVEYTGRRETEQVGGGWLDAVHPDDRDRLSDTWLAAVACGTIFDSEFRIRRHDGAYRWFKTRAVPVSGPSGTLAKWYGSNTDIEDLKRASELLQESETRFRTLVECLPDAIFLNVGGRMEFCNPACVRLFGATGPTDLIGKTPFDLHPPEWHDQIRSRIAEQHTTGERVPEVEEEALRLDGRRVPVSVTALPIVDRGVGALLVVLRDLTGQRRMEAQLRHQELMIREAGELAHVGGWGFDPATGQGDWTAETARIHGVDPSTDLVVADGLSRFEGEHRVRIEAAVADAVARGTPYDLELLMTAADGTRKWIRTICRPIVDNGKVVRVRGSIQDVTDRKRIEGELRALNAGLEQRVRDRTAELEAVNRELESFSYSVSHDLRAPIRHITAFTGIVLEECGPQLPEVSRGHLELVAKAGRRMGQLVDDLLSFSRLGRQALRRQPIATRQLIDECLHEAVGAVDGRRVETRVGDLPPCSGDIGLLRQVWLNLLSNAVKYSGKRDRAVIEVGAIPTSDGTAFFVRDNGVGFDMGYAHKLFGVFQRLHRAEDYEGTGIGLALVQRIIHRHEGRVWAEGEPGKGATFWFTLGPTS